MSGTKYSLLVHTVARCAQLTGCRCAKGVGRRAAHTSPSPPCRPRFFSLVPSRASLGLFLLRAPGLCLGGRGSMPRTSWIWRKATMRRACCRPHDLVRMLLPGLVPGPHTWDTEDTGAPVGGPQVQAYRLPSCTCSVPAAQPMRKFTQCSLVLVDK